MRFRIQVVIRVLLAIMFGLAAAYFWQYTPYWLMVVWMVLFFVITMIELIRFIEKSDQDLANFLLAIQQNDFTNSYPQVGQKSNRLFQVFNLITGEFIKLRNEKESNYHFLKTVVDHSGVPLLAFEINTDEITLINNSVKVLFGLPHFSKLSSLSRVDAHLVNTIKSMGPNDRLLVKTTLRGELTYLSVVANEVVISGERIKMLAFHNINAELDQKEIES